MADPDFADNDRQALLEETRKDKAQRAISARWEDEPETRWELHAGASKRIGDARLTALHPDAEALQNPPADVNGLSTPLLIEWFDLRLLLGADLLTAYWPSAGAIGGVLTDPRLAKVPHHGSTTGLHGVWSDVPVSNPVWIVSPFNQGKKLPSFDPDEGLERMLRKVEEVHLTALGRRPSGTVPSERRMRLSHARPLMDGRVRRGIAFKKTSTSPLGAAWVAASFNPAGELVGRVRHGQSAFTVTRG